MRLQKTHRLLVLLVVSTVLALGACSPKPRPATSTNTAALTRADANGSLPARPPFEIVTWYDTWNQTGLNNLLNKKVPLHYATRYNLAFGQLSATANGYTIEMTGQFADEVKKQILLQAPGVTIYAGLGDTGIAATVLDNIKNQNRSTRNIVAWLQTQGYHGISINAEGGGMCSVPVLVTQLGPSFRAAGLGIAVSVPWPGNGPTSLYGDMAVQAFNENVDALELQDYSSSSTPDDVKPWIQAGVKASILLGESAPRTVTCRPRHHSRRQPAAERQGGSACAGRPTLPLIPVTWARQTATTRAES